MCQVDSDDENQELTEREKQLTFLQSTIIVNPSKPNITIEEDDDYRYPGRFFIKINFCNEITIIGLNGNCSNKFIYEGKEDAERHGDSYEIHEVTVNLDYQQFTNTKKSHELYSCFREGNDEPIKQVNTKRMKEIIETLKTELTFTELTNLDFLSILEGQLHKYYIAQENRYLTDCFLENDVLLDIEDFGESKKEE